MARARVTEFVRKFLYTGDLAVLAMVRDSLASGSWRGTAAVLRAGRPTDPPACDPPPLGHEVTTCPPSQCCRDLACYLASDTGCAVVAATRACVAGHADYAWNAMETFSGHDPYVSLLKQVYGVDPRDEFVRCAAMVCRGEVRASRQEPGQAPRDPSALEYLRVVPKSERRRSFREPAPPGEPQVKGVTVDGWREGECTVRVVLE